MHINKSVWLTKLQGFMTLMQPPNQPWAQLASCNGPASSVLAFTLADPAIMACIA
jgi:hypothetical protein